MAETTTAETALVIAVEARTLAKTAHDRANGIDEKLETMAAALTTLAVEVAKLNTKAAFYAGVGAAIASAAVGVGLHFWG